MNKTKSKRRILIAVVIGGLIVIFGIGGGIGPIQFLYNVTVMPASRSLSSLGSGFANFFGVIGDVNNLASKNTALEIENAKLRGRLASSDNALLENADLRRQLGLQIVANYNQIGADVVLFQPDTYRKFVTLDKGSSSGIRVGQAGLNNGVIVGTISSVNSSSSKLQLITDPVFALAVRDQETGALGVLRGQLGGGITVENISRTDTIRPGDTIVSSGLGGIVPENLLIGQVESINDQAGGIFKQAQVLITLIPEQLRFVFIVAGK
jgi:rod shape-determining protein MreC